MIRQKVTLHYQRIMNANWRDFVGKAQVAQGVATHQAIKVLLEALGIRKIY